MNLYPAKRLLPWAAFAILFVASAAWITKPLFPSDQPAVTHISLSEPTSEIVPPKPADPPPPKPLSNRIVEYHIVAALQAKDKVIDGQQEFTWKNPGTVPVNELYFHLYPNAFQSKDTTFLRESGGKLRNDKMRDGSYGSMTISSLKTVLGEDLMPTIQYVQPDDGNKKDMTLMKVTLPAPVPSGGKVTLNTTFSVKLPTAFARMGYAGDFVMAGQWFPKVAVYETKGTRGRTTEGWNLHQYHGNSEFYSDFGIYDVKIKVPSTYTVAATGFPTRSPSIDGGVKTYQFYADDVHDFGWAASPDFQYVEEKFSSAKVPGVKIKLYLDPDHAHLKSRYITAAKKALANYSEWFGTYPYSTLSIVVPPKDGNGAGGMEYPTLVTSWGAGTKNPGLDLERVVVHEIGHQYFYGMLASNEFEEAWLDEGFTSYAEDLLMEKEYGSRSGTAIEASYITSPESLHQNAWDYRNHDVYAENVYTRGKLVLKTIEGQVGKSTMEKVLRTYFERFKFRHPSTKDFQTVLEEVTKTTWAPFFDQYVYGAKMVDYSIESIRTPWVSGTAGKPGMYDNSIKVRKLGGDHTPVPIVFHFADGSKVEKVWDGKESEVEFKLPHSAPIEWAVVDPAHTMILENKHINNFMKTEIDTKWNTRFNLGAVKLIETLFNWVAM